MTALTVLTIFYDCLGGFANLVRNLLEALELLHLRNRVERRRQPPVRAEQLLRVQGSGFRVQGSGSRVQGVAGQDLLVDGGGEGEVVEEVCETLPHVRAAQGTTRYLLCAGFSEMCSGSEAGSYLRLIDFVEAGKHLPYLRTHSS